MKQKTEQRQERYLWLLKFMVVTYGYSFRRVSLRDIAADYKEELYNIQYWINKLQKSGYIEINAISPYKREFIINKEKYEGLNYGK